ncbi:MAG: hypothetical protein FJ253_06800 [Phycisphaerae bacterium]|nr:hypothetical protein [Phycisphaerae bacterium]
MGEWTNRISTALIATVVTLLIWTWAAEKTLETQTISGAVRFVPGEGQSLSVEPSQPVPVTIEVKGSRQSIRQAESLLEKGVDLKLGLGGVPAAPGNFNVVLKGAIADLPQIQRSDLVVEAVKPDSVTITIGRLVTRTVKIEAVLPLAQISGAVAIEPAEAQVTLPEALADASPKARLEAFVDVRALEPGRHTLEVPLRLPEVFQSARGETKVVPERVKVTFRLESRDRTAVLPTVPVQVAGPPVDLRNFEVQIEPGSEFLRSVTVSGPGDAISQIESGKARIAAIVHLGADDLARRINARQVSMWLLPPGVTVTKIGGSNETTPSIPLRITERPRTSPPVEPAAPPRN